MVENPIHHGRIWSKSHSPYGRYAFFVFSQEHAQITVLVVYIFFISRIDKLEMNGSQERQICNYLHKLVTTLDFNEMQCYCYLFATNDVTKCNGTTQPLCGRRRARLHTVDTPKFGKKVWVKRWWFIYSKEVVKKTKTKNKIKRNKWCGFVVDNFWSGKKNTIKNRKNRSAQVRRSQTRVRGSAWREAPCSERVFSESSAPERVC